MIIPYVPGKKVKYEELKMLCGEDAEAAWLDGETCEDIVSTIETADNQVTTIQEWGLWSWQEHFS